MTLILGIDPGLTTGAALIHWSGNHPLGSKTVQIRQFWEITYDEMPVWANEWLPKVEHVAVERFQITGRTLQSTRQYEALYTIGGIVFLVALMGEVWEGPSPQIHMASPSTAKRAWDNDHLKDAGLFKETRGFGHARDALRHALLCCHSL